MKELQRRETKNMSSLRARVKESYSDYDLRVRSINGIRILTSESFDQAILKKLVSLFADRPTAINYNSCYFQTHYLLKHNPAYQALKTGLSKLVVGNHMIAFGDGALIDFSAKKDIEQSLDIAVLPLPNSAESLDSALALAKVVYLGEWELYDKDALFRLLG